MAEAVFRAEPPDGHGAAPRTELPGGRRAILRRAALPGRRAAKLHLHPRQRSFAPPWVPSSWTGLRTMCCRSCASARSGSPTSWSAPGTSSPAAGSPRPSWTAGRTSARTPWRPLTWRLAAMSSRWRCRPRPTAVCWATSPSTRRSRPRSQPSARCCRASPRCVCWWRTAPPTRVTRAWPGYWGTWTTAPGRPPTGLTGRCPARGCAIRRL
mmetsp:Transcript_42157/g.131183  ORF Transcript_42157/g.131183 Transcript_42157/m.131183 type:complete len:211 (-) Transcript_42157:429-1061(-)